MEDYRIITIYVKDTKENVTKVNKKLWTLEEVKDFVFEYYGVITIERFDDVRLDIIFNSLTDDDTNLFIEQLREL